MGFLGELGGFARQFCKCSSRPDLWNDLAKPPRCLLEYGRQWYTQMRDRREAADEKFPVGTLLYTDGDKEWVGEA
jgi:hypothetical protein